MHNGLGHGNGLVHGNFLGHGNGLGRCGDFGSDFAATDSDFAATLSRALRRIDTIKFAAKVCDQGNPP